MNRTRLGLADGGRDGRRAPLVPRLAWSQGGGLFCCLLLLGCLTLAASAATVVTTNAAGSLVLTNGFGDLNADGGVDVRDVVLFARHLSGAGPLPPSLTNRLDLNQDGQATEADRVILARLVAARFVRADEDFDGDELANAEELARNTNPLDPDTDHDGSLDGWEVAEGTDPLDPNSRIPLFVLARPPVQIISPLLQDTDTNTQGVVVARPPVQVIHPLIQDVDTNMLGVILARPPVELYLPALGQFDEVGAITVGGPPVEVVYPLLQHSDTNGVGSVIGQPPVTVINTNNPAK